MLGIKSASFTLTVLLSCAPMVIAAPAQDRGYHDARRNDLYNSHRNFYNGVRQGGHGGDYYDSRHARDGYDERYERRRGGIGPGKGAAIGGVGGAVLGAALGGGLKGSLIGGAAGAGIGAVIGAAAQDHRR